MRFILLLIYIIAWIIGGIGLENTGDYSPAFYALYGVIGTAVYVLISGITDE